MMVASEVHVHLERPTERSRYAVEQVLASMLGWSVRWVPSVEDLLAIEGPKLLYGSQHRPGVFTVVPAGLLEETGVRPLDPERATHAELPVLFPVSGGPLPFDPFAAAFFQLTRYEEVLGMEEDLHGRPVAARLHAARHGYLDRPIVDEWAMALARSWKAMDPLVPEPRRTYRKVDTIDLDNGFKYLGRPLWRTLGSMVRDVIKGDPGEISRRWDVLGGRQKDPYDVYDDLRSCMGRSQDRTVFFILSAPRRRWDHAVPLSFAPYASRIRELAEWAEVGLHPSYGTSEDEAMATREREALAGVTDRPVTASRQHFLRMRLPHTYRMLERMGIRDEYSMGLHDALGFRAGTSMPYRWYDLLDERSTTLTVHPFAVMDNTLRVKLGLSPEQAVERVERIVQRIRAVEGTFTAIWHESFLADEPANASWRKAIMEMMERSRS